MGSGTSTRLLLASAVALLAMAGCGGASAAGRVPVVTPPTGVTSAELTSFLGNGLRYSDDGDFGLDKGSLLDEPGAPGGRVLRVAYPAGSASRSAGGPEGGLQAYLQLAGGPAETAELEYSVRFPAGFDFVKGGKLPGFYGGTVTGGREIPDGTDGLSTRYMWRADGAGEVYAYLPSSEEHGTSLGRGCWSFTPGEWTTMRQRVQLNTPGGKDGRVTVWQDGRQVLDVTGLEFRSAADLRIDGLFFSTFFGGSDSSWASPVDQYTDFAGFRLSVPAAAAPAPAAGGTCAETGDPK
ncbi:polysaccharide lyase [Pseudonocardia sp. TRM90224]|uniref:polysaccharide lyase n=1 Tax=Pseudonocardia sp. TRM90224 TaxID=2812678 RepID=UPI001E2DE065|nr:hypothetical protein [Pseudonocardia sp. TRM90224]